MVQRKKVTDLFGFKQGRLTVVEYIGKGKFDKHLWLCNCECGGSIVLNTSTIKNGYTKSCGCLRKETLLSNRCDPERHGYSKHKLYGIYHSMLYRCYSDKAPRWKYYGGKGIRVCEHWRSDVMNFITWALENGYEPGLSIDRIDNNKDYEPSNCEWVTISENTRRSNAPTRNEKSS